MALALAGFLFFPSGTRHQPGSVCAHARAAASASRELVWSDEFDGPDGSMPDPHKWKIVNGGGGFGNNELEYYTGRPENVHIENGNLVLIARRESYRGHGAHRGFTSARLETLGRFDQQYGRIEARIKMPAGQGLWPAFWMMGSNVHSVNWPACGEIDIMENIGSEPSSVHGSLHGPGYSGSHSLTGTYTLPDHARFADDYHVFAVEWEPGVIRFYVDDVLYETRSATQLPPGAHWAFDHPFYVLLDLAVGGNWPGSPDGTSTFPARMLVDYVRVYRLPGAHS